MMKSMKIVAALGIAGLSVLGGSAYTAANTMPDATSAIAGYGGVSTTGATVTNIAYTVNGTDKSKVDSIVFTATEDVSTAAGYTATMTLSTDGTGTAYTCTAVFASATTVTCALGTAGSIAIADVPSVGLTVLHTSA